VKREAKNRKYDKPETEEQKTGKQKNRKQRIEKIGD
jgi:hypothetical protein